METLDIVIIMDIAIGAYLLYAGISGKGNVYQNNRLPDEVKEDAKKLLRVIALLCWLFTISFSEKNLANTHANRQTAPGAELFS